MEEARHDVIPDTQVFRDIFNASPIGIVVENLDGQPLFVNGAFCSMLGSTEEELRTKHCVDFSPREDAEKDWALFQQLRAGSIDHYQLDKRYFRRDGSVVWGNLSISLLNSRPSPLVLAMVSDITQRKEAEEALADSEERLRLAVQVGKMFAYSWDAATDVIERSGESAEILGVTKGDDAATGAAVSAMVHPDDKTRLETALKGLCIENPNLRISYRIIRPDGAVTWLERSSRAYFDDQGKLKRMVGMIVDVTERKRAKQLVVEMTRKLIEAQEQERARIARELHDDISQRVAMLSIEIERLERRPEAPSEIRNTAHEISERTKELSTDIQALSHELHSSKLEYLGIVGGMKSWCREFGERQGMQIEFKHCGSLSSLPSQTSVCLFRVLQEALHNTAKHSGVKNVDVELRMEPSEVQLIVHDLGKGFDVAAAMQGRGLGVISMLERVRLLRGTVTIDSKPHGGTTIYASIPLEAYQAQQAGL